MSRVSLAGRKCLVTGGTRGIGFAIATEVLALGGQVFVCARSKDDVEATVRTLQHKGSVQGCAADLSDPQHRQQLMRQVSSAFGGELNVLVCNAGTNTQLPTLQYSQEDYSRIVGLNLESTYALCQLAQPLLVAGASSCSKPADSAEKTAGSTCRRPAGDSCIIFISSVAGGPLAGGSGSLYAISKAGLNQLAASLACEWAKHGIRLNSVAPWVTLTELGKQNLQDSNRLEQLLSRTPLGRLAEPEDVSGLVAFLASPAASFITGQTIAVDGGYSVMGLW